MISALGSGLAVGSTLKISEAYGAGDYRMALRNLGSESVGIVMGVSNSLTALFSSIVAFFVVRGIKKKIGRDTA